MVNITYYIGIGRIGPAKVRVFVYTNEDCTEFFIISQSKKAGIGNANPQSLELFQAEFVHLFYGKAMIIVKSDLKQEKIHVEGTAAGLAGHTIDIAVK